MSSSSYEEPRSSAMQGFTTVELVVVIIVAALFVISCYQLFQAIVAVNLSSDNKAVASNLAYNNLRKYASTELPIWFVCDTSSDLRNNPTATGQLIESGTVTGTDITPPVTKTITAFAPYGCASATNPFAIRVESKITYGPRSETVVHATYVGY